MTNIIVKTVLAVLLLFLVACQNEPKDAVKDTKPFKKMDTLQNSGTKGVVVTTMNSGTYTYVEVDTGSKKIWAAGPETVVKEGDEVSLAEGTVMTNFYAKSLDRTFESILFAPQIMVEGQGSSMMGGDQPKFVPEKPKLADAPLPGSIAKAEGGYTVEELFTMQGKLDGKAVTVKGKVVKDNKNIINSNWYHLRDGSGKEGTNDITISSKDEVNAGDIVVAQGTFRISKDVGEGFIISPLIDEAKLTVAEAEKK